MMLSIMFTDDEQQALAVILQYRNAVLCTGGVAMRTLQSFLQWVDTPRGSFCVLTGILVIVLILLR